MPKFTHKKKSINPKNNVKSSWEHYLEKFISIHLIQEVFEELINYMKQLKMKENIRFH